MTAVEGPIDPVAVVTGAGRGIGRGIAQVLAANGFDVVLGWQSDEAAVLETVALVEAAGRRAVPVKGDVAEAGTATALLAAATDELGGLGAWVANAGTSMLAPVLDTSVEQLTRMFDVNVVGVFHGLQAAARFFVAGHRPGRIVTVASEVGVRAFPLLGGYAATKFAVVGLTQAAALELAPFGIAVNAVCPGTAETDMVLAERASEVGLTGLAAPEVRQAYLDAIPAGRFCTPDDVGALVAFLCSPGAAYLTGQALCVNGASVVR